MLGSSSWQYAARIILHLARLGPESRVDARALAGATALPVAFTGKLVSQLAAAGLVDARRGPGGGLRLARRAAEIRLREVMVAVGAGSGLDRCALGFAVCSDQQDCELHPAWSALKHQLGTLLDRTVDSWLLESVPTPRTSEVGELPQRYDPLIKDELL